MSRWQEFTSGELWHAGSLCVTDADDECPWAVPYPAQRPED